jgi:hypothetical protein
MLPAGGTSLQVSETLASGFRDVTSKAQADIRSGAGARGGFTVNFGGEQHVDPHEPSEFLNAPLWVVAGVVVLALVAWWYFKRRR